MEKFIVKPKDSENHTYGIWNNDMVAFRYIYDWNGTETDDLKKANLVCSKLNNICSKYEFYNGKII